MDRPVLREIESAFGEIDERAGKQRARCILSHAFNSKKAMWRKTKELL